MRKIVPLIAASALIICTLPSCSSGGSIVGRWEMSELADSGIKVGGLEFKENGKGSMYMDTTEILHADGKKIQVGAGDDSFTFDEQYIDYDTTNLKIEISGQDMLTLERSSGKGSDSSYDGEYKLLSGVLYDTIVSGIDEKNGGDINVFITFDGSSSEVTFVDIFNYKASKGKLELSGYASFIGEDADGKPVTAEYEIEGDKLTVTNESGSPEVLTRVKK